MTKETGLVSKKANTVREYKTLFRVLDGIDTSFNFMRMLPFRIWYAMQRVVLVTEYRLRMNARYRKLRQQRRGEFMDWQEALKANYGDYAYGPRGDLLIRETDGTYTVRSGKFGAAILAGIVGNWSRVERVGVSAEDIPTTLTAMNIPVTGWSYE